jgi:hypothetical protein|tara:strand:+ start:203 stop:358 length:156 start_codon:yes stop_codon:yes gene_type:complete
VRIHGPTENGKQENSRWDCWYGSTVDLIGCKLDMNISEENTSTYMDEKKYM